MKSIFDMTQAVNEDSDPVLVWEAIVSTAIRASVSDIHVLAQKEGYHLVFRIDGDIHFQGATGLDFGRRIINHVKSLSGIDLGENRRPTEGRMLLKVDEKAVDLRVSVVPTLHGQDMVVRVFDRTINLMDMHELGLTDAQLGAAYDMMSRPHGLILVCGATGSGKTTTLYAMLRRLAGGNRKIMTIEDPVEFDLEGVNQTQVNPKINVTFASLLSSILRQDTDVIMVGEIRDEQTAITAVRAANTGNLVLATTHATRATRAVETMLGLGVHPYFLAVALRGVLSQVLVKRICPQCKMALPDTTDMIVDENIRQRLKEKGVSPQLYHGQGCEHCYGLGYKGRMGLFELFVTDDKIKQMILDRRPATEMDQAAFEGKQLTLEQSGKIAALSGLTTMNELVDNLPLV